MPLRKPVLASLLMGAVVGPLVALEAAKAQTVSQPGYSRTTECFRDEYRDEYVPGTKDSPGYIRNWTEKVKIACADKPIQAPRQEPQAADVDNNSCVEGSVIGDCWAGLERHCPGTKAVGLEFQLELRRGRWSAAKSMEADEVGCASDGGTIPVKS